MTKKQASSFRKSALVRWVMDEKKQTLIAETPHDREALVEGELTHYQIKNGFAIHCGTTHELLDFQVISTAQKTVSIIILLEGKLDFSYDDVRFVFDAAGEPQGLMVNLNRPATFRRHIQPGNRVTKLNILLPAEWIRERAGEDEDPSIHDFVTGHLASFPFVLTPQLLARAKEVMRCSSARGLVERLHLETIAQMLIAQIFSQLGCVVPTSSATAGECLAVANHQDKHRSLPDKLVSYIESHLDGPLSARELAAFAGMSESNLQRKFKTAVGFSIQSYIRRRRLEIARQHLERGVATVTEVAYSAGYRHPANFTNAFKKAFGYPPVEAVNKSI